MKRTPLALKYLDLPGKEKIRLLVRDQGIKQM